MGMLFDPANYALTPYAVPPLLVGAVTALLGCVVLVRERGTFVSVAFGLMTLAAAVWLESYVGIFSARADAVALWWARIENAAVAFIPSLVYLFTLAVVQRVPQYRLMLGACLVVSGGFALAVLGTHGFVAGLYHYPWGAYARYGLWSFPFLAFFVGLMLVSFRHYWVEMARCHSEPHRRRLQEFFWGFCIAYLGSVDYLPCYGIPVYPIGYLPVFAFLVMAAGAIWRYRLVDITPAFAARQIITTMADAVLVVDCEGTIRVLNEAACRLFERSRDQLVGRPITELDPQFFGTRNFGTVLRTGTMERSERVYTSPSKGPVALELSVSTLPDHAGQTVGVVCIARDITERRRAEQVVQESKIYAESIADTVREPVVVLDVNLRIKSANPSFYQTFRVSPDEARNRYIYELGDGQWNVSKLRGMLNILPRNAPFQGIEVDYEFPHVGCRTLLINARRIHRVETNTEIILLAMEDVTERKRIEEQLKAAIAELEASQAALRDGHTPPPGSTPLAA